jgi:hypothetical protein
MSDKLIKKEKLEGRVAQILNARELVINIGEEKGVTPGMRFSVLSGEPLEIRDPETNELLDTFAREKVRIEAFEVRPKISICKTYRVKVTEGGFLYKAVDPLGRGPFNIGHAFNPPQKKVETLEAKDVSLPPPLSPEESYVKMNDKVIQIDDD